MFSAVLATGTDDAGGHEAMPDPDSGVRGLDGDPASLLNPGDYPVITICLRCGQPVRCEKWLMGEWVHL